MKPPNPVHAALTWNELFNDSQVASRRTYQGMSLDQLLEIRPKLLSMLTRDPGEPVATAALIEITGKISRCEWKPMPRPSAKHKIRWHPGSGPDDQYPEPGDWYAEVDGIVVCTGSKIKGDRYLGRAVGITVHGNTLNEFKTEAERYIYMYPDRIEKLRSPS